METRRTVATVVSLCWLFIGVTVRGDGVCEREHNTTAGERSTMTRVLETARQSLPPPPADWVIVGDDQISVPSGFCMDSVNTLAYSFGRSYGNRNQQKQQASDQAMAAAAKNVQADLARKQPQLDALMARANALSQQVAQAAQAGDQAKIERLNRELEKVTNEYTQLIQQGDTTAQVEAAGAESLRDIDMDVAVRVNPAGVSIPANAKPIATPAGARTALGWNTTREGVTYGHAVVLIGPWKSNGPGKGWAPAATRAPTVEPGWYAVEVNADPSRIAAMVSGTDTAALAATIK